MFHSKTTSYGLILNKPYHNWWCEEDEIRSNKNKNVQVWVHLIKIKINNNGVCHTTPLARPKSTKSTRRPTFMFNKRCIKFIHMCFTKTMYWNTCEIKIKLMTQLRKPPKSHFYHTPPLDRPQINKISNKDYIHFSQKLCKKYWYSFH